MKAVLVLLVMFSSTSWAADDLVRRIAVFPLQADVGVQSAADKAWWKIREVLTSNQRFTVASRRFMRQKSVFKSKSEIKPADTVVLARILDAHAVVSAFVENDVLNFRVYYAADGADLWKADHVLIQGRPIGPQIISGVEKLTRAFIASIPFHGYQVKKNAIGPVVQSEGDVHLAKIDIGRSSNIQVGEKVQWVRMKRTQYKPLYQGGLELEVYAQGEILSFEKNTATVELTKYFEIADLKEFSTVFVPGQAKRLKEKYALRNTSVDQLIRESGHLSETSGAEEKESSLPFVLEFLGSMALVILVAI